MKNVLTSTAKLFTLVDHVHLQNSQILHRCGNFRNNNWYEERLIDMVRLISQPVTEFKITGVLKSG